LVSSLAIDPLTRTTLYAGTQGGGVYKSSNSGGNWAQVNTGISNLFVLAVAIDPLSPTTLYAGTGGGGVFKSIDSGGNWNPINNGLPVPVVNTIAIDPLTPSILYAGAGILVFKSIDAGENWLPATVGITSLVNTLVIDPLTTNTLYAGTMGGGVLQSLVAGAVWLPINNGLTTLLVQALAIDPQNPTTLYAGTYGGGVFVNGETTPVCPVSVAVENRTDGRSILATLYRFRDEVMTASPERARYTKLFYTHAVEGSRILLANAGLRSKVATMLSQYLPKFQDAVERRRVSIRLAEQRDMDALIQEFIDKASPTLRTDLGKIRQELRDGKLLAAFGVRLAE
jgi:hypothetical protein